MGFAISWVAVPEEHANDFVSRLHLRSTGKRIEFPESLICMGRLNTGWRLVWYNEFDCPFLMPRHLTELSKTHALIHCQVEEHVMASSAEGWRNGTCEWRISHEGENGPHGLEVQGRPPASFVEIRYDLEHAQKAAGGDKADVDHIFDIPLSVAKSIVGFKHDENYAAPIGGDFEVMERR